MRFFRFFRPLLRPFSGLAHHRQQDMSRFTDIQLDAEVIRSAAAGDRDAMRVVYDQAAGPMFGLVLRVIRDRATAEDLFQDSMETVLRQLPQYRGDAPLGAWLRQVTLSHCLMYLRSPWQRARRALRELLAENAPVVELPMAELMDLERAMARLSDTARTVLWLHDAEGLTHEEIAAAFGRTTSFSKTQLARAHRALRTSLQDHGEPPCLTVPLTPPQ
jgi:RNA polymerase sigma factor (sigma-70 family)